MRSLPKIRTKRRADGSVYYQIRIHGRDIHLGVDQRAARRRATELLHEAYRDEAATSQPRFVATLVERWKEERPGDRSPWSASTWVRYAGKVALDEITPDHLEGYVRWMQTVGYHVKPSKHARGHTPERRGKFSAWSIRERVGYALRICRWAVDRGWMQRVPRHPRTPMPVRRPRDIKPAQLAALFESLPDRAGNLLRFCLETSARPAEARMLRWDSVDVAAKVARLPEHKTASRTGREKCLFLSDSAIQAMPERQPTCPWVFPSRLGKPYSESGLRSILRAHAPGITPYQMRHTFAQHAADSGMGIDDLAGLLGHADTRTTRFYMEIRNERLRRAAESLASPLSGLLPSGPADPAKTSAPSKRGKGRRGRSAKGRAARAG